MAPDATLARVFGVLEGVTMAALALGTLVAPVLVQLLGTAGALAVSAAIVPLMTLVFRGPLARADASGVVHEEELGLIRALPMFAPLRVTALERIAQELDHLRVHTGDDIIREGELGDRFYLIGEGQCVVLIGGRAVTVMGVGDGFGEIALLNDVPRTATVRALTDVELYRPRPRAVPRGRDRAATQPGRRAGARGPAAGGEPTRRRGARGLTAIPAGILRAWTTPARSSTSSATRRSCGSRA